MTPFPLAWPETMPRNNVQDSLRLFASDSRKSLSGVVISSNVTLGVNSPSDPGVAVWFTWDGLSICIPVDRYNTVAANLQAIHHIIEARRVELRHGTLALVRATFTGFTALPAPSGKRTWMAVLDLDGWERTGLTRDKIEAQFKRLANVRHPDKPGGSTEAMAELNRARGEALTEIGA